MKRNMPFKPISSGPKSLAIFLVLAALGLLLVLQLTEYSRTTQPLSYSSFIEYVEQDRIKSVFVSGQKAIGFMKEGSRFETVVPENHPQLWDILRAHHVELSVTEAGSSPGYWYWLLVGFFFAVVLSIVWFLVRQAKNSPSNGNGIFSMGKSRARMFLPSQIKVNFNDVAGVQEAKHELKDIVEFLKNPEKMKRMGARLPSGILLVGDPGNGKTLLARATAGEANCPFFSVNGSEFVEVYVGVGASRIRDLFANARRHAPCIVFIDEIDAIGRQRGAGLGGGNDEREQTLNQLLTEMDGFDPSTSPVIVIGATNIPDVLDKALLRPGRFDRRVSVPYPDHVAREAIIKVHAKTVRFSPSIDIHALAEKTAGFSGADLSSLVNQAALIASKKDNSEVMPEDIEEARVRVLRSRELQNETQGVLHNQGAAHVKMFMADHVKTKFSDVAGVYEAKEELKDVVDFLREPEKFKRLGARIPRGVLLVGEPGNGKTLLARAVAGEAGRPFFAVSGSDFIEMYVGVGASRVRELFATARKHAPAIIFIDEIDTLGARRSSDGAGGDREHAQTLNQLLTEMDGFDSAGDIILIGATNRVDILDKALLRPGRFDRQIMVPYPDMMAREEILRVHARKVTIDPAIDLAKIARGTSGFSGADLANLINEAALDATKHSHEAISIADLEEARDKIILGKTYKHKIMSKKELEVTAYHEAGHALVRLMLPLVSDPLYKVTITPRGMSLGATHWLPERDKYSTSKEEMLASITSALGGRVAEDVVFSVVSTGASSDFKVATSIARSMVCLYGMSATLGPVSYEDAHYSQDTARRIDEEVRAIIESCYKHATEIITTHRDKLAALAQALLDKETLSAEEVYELLGIEPRTTHSIR